MEITKEKFDELYGGKHIQQLHPSWISKYDLLHTDGLRSVYKVKNKSFLEPWMNELVTFSNWQV